LKSRFYAKSILASAKGSQMDHFSSGRYENKAVKDKALSSDLRAFFIIRILTTKHSYPDNVPWLRFCDGKQKQSRLFKPDAGLW
jgi:hypothetical protein